MLRSAVSASSINASAGVRASGDADTDDTRVGVRWLIEDCE
jgi:hypothetical protein